jgi:hypothetical protein
MGERRSNRGIHRTDQQILDHATDVWLLTEVAAGRVRTHPQNRMDLRRLASDGLILAGFGTGALAALLPRGQRIVAAARGEYTLPREDG